MEKRRTMGRLGSGRRAVMVMILVVTGLLASSMAWAQTDLARQQLESGIQFYDQQRYNQALNDFQAIVTSMPDSEFADDALLRIARYYLEVEEDFDTAREKAEEVLRLYPRGNAAPGAYYYLGEVIFRSDRTGRGIDDALANFQRVFLYEDNPWIPAAVYATGRALERQGNFEDAVDAYFQVIVDYPRSAWSAGAQLGVGRSFVRQGQSLEAMAQFQEVRNAHPDTMEAEIALDWLTLLYRLYGASSLGKPVAYRRDPNFNIAMKDKFKDVMAVRLSSNEVHVLERGRDRVISFNRSGELSGTKRVADPYSLFVDARGQLIVANEKAAVVGGQASNFTVPSEKGPEPLEKIRVVARDRLGELYVYDDKQKHILRYDASGSLVGPFPSTTRREVLAMEIDELGNLIVLEKKNRDVEVFTPEGRVRAKIVTKKGTLNLKKAADIALDPAGFLYILDEDSAQIAIFNASYEFVTMLSKESLGGGLLGKPVTMDVDASGDLYVYDDKEKAVVRLH